MIETLSHIHERAFSFNVRWRSFDSRKLRNFVHMNFKFIKLFFNLTKFNQTKLNPCMVNVPYNYHKFLQVKSGLFLGQSRVNPCDCVGTIHVIITG
jgi:hypothetical protein